MVVDKLAATIGTPRAAVERLLAMSQSEIYEDAEYRHWVSQLHPAPLHRTLGYARQAYDRHLSQLAKILRDEYGFVNVPMSAFTLGNWLVAFLAYTESLSDMTRIHARLPQAAVARLLPEILNALGEMPEGAQEWQRALAVLTLPLLAPKTTPSQIAESNDESGAASY